MDKILKDGIVPILMALFGYIFSIHVDFINMKSKISEHEKSFEYVREKIDKVDSKIDYILEHFKN